MFAVNAHFLYASMRTKERRSLDINICTKVRVPQASSLKHEGCHYATMSNKTSARMKGIWEYFPRHSSGEYKVQRNASCAVNAMAKKLLSPPPLLPSPRNTRHKCTGPEGRGESKMASHFLGGPFPSTSCNDVGIQEAGGKFLCISMTLRM